MHGDYPVPTESAINARATSGAIGGIVSEKAYLNEQNRAKQAQTSPSRPPNQHDVQGLDVMISINLDAARTVYFRARNLRDRLAGIESPEEPSIVAPSLGGPTKDSLQAANYYHEETAQILERVYGFLFN